MKKAVVFVLLVFTILSVSAQDRPLRVGLKVGFPSMIGLSSEYVTKNWNEKFAITLNASYVSLNEDNFEFLLSYFSLGAKYYFFKPYKGFYGGLNLGGMHLKSWQEYDVYQSHSLVTATDIFESKFLFALPNIGYRFIISRFSISLEAGYSLNESIKYTEINILEGAVSEHTLPNKVFFMPSATVSFEFLF